MKEIVFLKIDDLPKLGFRCESDAKDFLYKNGYRYSTDFDEWVKEIELTSIHSFISCANFKEKVDFYE